MAVEPCPTRWVLPDPKAPETIDDDLVGIGADLEPGTLLAAYRTGLFPMPINRRSLGWWSPTRRGILPLKALHVSKSLQRSCGRFEIRVDTAFEAVIEACSKADRPHGWITADLAAAYARLFELGWAHSVETWSRTSGALVGGLYGIAIGGLFAGESMFHRERDASKAALVALVKILRTTGSPEDRVLDVQWHTPHLASLGVVEIDRAEYLGRLVRAIELPLPAEFQ